MTAPTAPIHRRPGAAIRPRRSPLPAVPWEGLFLEARYEDGASYAGDEYDDEAGEAEQG